MGQLEKLYRDIKNNPRNVRFKELEKLLTKAGNFDCQQGKGDHYAFTHRDLPYPIVVDSRGKHKPLLPVYVRNAIKAFDEVNPDFGRED